MKRIVKSIPNAITSANLLFGCLAIVEALNNDFITAFYFMLISALMDFFDGFSARILKAYSPIGKELDSLADMVSFGVVPSCVMFSMGCGIFSFIIAIFSALRLAKFNIDTRQTTQFIGLPTPANALFFCSIGYIIQTNGLFATVFSNDYFMYSAIVCCSLLLISEIPMFSLKFTNWGFKKNRTVYLFLVLSTIAIVFFRIDAIPFIIFSYIFISVLTSRPFKKSISCGKKQII